MGWAGRALAAAPDVQGCKGDRVGRAAGRPSCCGLPMTAARWPTAVV